jgi:hypothetical protein
MRADTMAAFAPATWDLVRRSGLRMAYIGAEAGSDEALRAMKKGTRVEHTIEVAARCREAGVIPEISFVLGGPDDPEGAIEQTLAFIRRVKAHTRECEVILLASTTPPQRDRALPIGRSRCCCRPTDRGARAADDARRMGDAAVGAIRVSPGRAVAQPSGRERVADFARVLGCRFPTVRDHRTPRWGKAVWHRSRGGAYASGDMRTGRKLDIARRLIPSRNRRSTGCKRRSRDAHRSRHPGSLDATGAGSIPTRMAGGAPGASASSRWCR